MPNRLQTESARRRDADQSKLLASGLTITGEAVIEIAAAEGDEKKLPTFKMNAYNGGPMYLSGFYYPAVVDLSGLKFANGGRVPARMQHDAMNGVGHTTKVEVKGNKLFAEGVISRATDAAREVVESSGNGFPWQASIGARAERVEFVKEGASVTVNGKKLSGPLNVARAATLAEISFVDLGADDTTSARIAAHNTGGSAMNFEKWLEARNIDANALNDQNRAALQAMFDAEQAGTQAPADPPAKEEAKKVQASAAGGELPSADEHIEQIRAAHAGEMKRLAAIRDKCKGHPDIEAKAIEEGWTADKAELEVLRAAGTRNAQFGINTNQDETPRGDLIEAALCLDMTRHCRAEPGETGRGGASVEAQRKIITAGLDEKTMEAAQKRYPQGIGLQDVLMEAAWANGHHFRTFRSVPLKDLLRAAFPPIQAGFSTMSLSGIFSNVMNKGLLAAFEAVESTWRQISATSSLKDFKQGTRYRLNASMEYEELGPTGQIKHGELGESSYTQQLKTQAKMFSLTRQDIINDDLGALDSLRRFLGRGAALRLNKVFWTEFMDNSTFFASGNGNYQSGAATALSIAALTAGELLFLNQTDPSGHPAGIMPEILLVPNALFVTANQVMSNTQVRHDSDADGDAAVYMTSNPHAGKFRVVRSSYLSNANITGYSALAWYLLANPADMPVIDTAFLNGNQAPTVESADADFNTLGVEFRGYHDFGVTKQEYRGGVKSKGEA